MPHRFPNPDRYYLRRDRWLWPVIGHSAIVQIILTVLTAGAFRIITLVPIVIGLLVAMLHGVVWLLITSSRERYLLWRMAMDIQIVAINRRIQRNERSIVRGADAPGKS